MWCPQLGVGAFAGRSEARRCGAWHCTAERCGATQRTGTYIHRNAQSSRPDRLGDNREAAAEVSPAGFSDLTVLELGAGLGT